MLLITRIFRILTALGIVLSIAYFPVFAQGDISSSTVDSAHLPLTLIPDLHDSSTYGNLTGARIAEKFQSGDFELYDLPSYAVYLIEFLIFYGGSVAVLFVAIGGFKYVTSGMSDSKEAGKKTILHALMGFAIAVLSWGLVNTVQVFVTSGDDSQLTTTTQTPHGVSQTPTPPAVPVTGADTPAPTPNNPVTTPRTPTTTLGDTPPATATPVQPATPNTQPTASASTSDTTPSAAAASPTQPATGAAATGSATPADQTPPAANIDKIPDTPAPKFCPTIHSEVYLRGMGIRIPESSEPDRCYNFLIPSGIEVILNGAVFDTQSNDLFIDKNTQSASVIVPAGCGGECTSYTLQITSTDGSSDTVVFRRKTGSSQ